MLQCLKWSQVRMVYKQCPLLLYVSTIFQSCWNGASSTSILKQNIQSYRELCKLSITHGPNQFGRGRFRTIDLSLCSLKLSLYMYHYATLPLLSHHALRKSVLSGKHAHPPAMYTPLKPHCCIVKQGHAGVHVYLFLLQNIDYGYSLEPPRRGSSNVYPLSMF